jgi:ribonuclease J
MRVCIHRGTKEIGGTCVEIESQGKRIVLDVGLPLDAADPDDFPLHPIKGFEKANPNLLGVVISHPHQDHYGLAYRLPKETLFLIGEAAENILAAADVFSPAGVRLKNVTHLVDRRQITLGPFTITPFLVDHSGYDAYAILIQADGAALFYSGDLRAHGRKGKLFQKLLRLHPEHVDVLLMEGTTIGRPGTDKGFPTEADLEDRFVKLFKHTPGMPLVWCSGQNIDRLVTIFRACKKTGRQLILDLYTAHVLQATRNVHVPQGGWDHVKVFVPLSQRIQIKKRQEFALINGHKAWRIYPESLAEVAATSVMLFRPSMRRDVKQAKCLEGSRLIYSMWSGYVRDEKAKPFLDWLKQHGIPMDECHTSGHASVADLVKLRKVFQKAPLVPIHTDEPDRFEELFGNVQRQGDGEWGEVGLRTNVASISEGNVSCER